MTRPDSTDPHKTRALEPAFGPRFQLIRRLGAGAMGDVYLAEDTKLLRRVAIKCIRAEHRGSSILLQRIKRECLLHARIGAHPHIVTLYDLLDSEGRLLIVMEYVEGESLSDFMKRHAGGRKPLKPEVYVNIAIQCLRALTHTHQHGIIHRDIKPANVMLAGGYPDRLLVKVMDFGIARMVDEDPSVTTLTQPGVRSPGTPLYMAPEQIDSGTYGPVTSSADLYAVGVMLYHMLSGRPPFTGTMTDIFNGHLNQTPRPVILPSGEPLHPDLWAAIARAMSKQPADRFPSAEAFADALRSALENPAIAGEATVELDAYPVGPVGRRRVGTARRAFRGATTFVALCLMMAAVAVWKLGVLSEGELLPEPAPLPAEEIATESSESATVEADPVPVETPKPPAKAEEKLEQPRSAPISKATPPREATPADKPVATKPAPPAVVSPPVPSVPKPETSGTVEREPAAVAVVPEPTPAPTPVLPPVEAPMEPLVEVPAAEEAAVVVTAEAVPAVAVDGESNAALPPIEPPLKSLGDGAAGDPALVDGIDVVDHPDVIEAEMVYNLEAVTTPAPPVVAVTLPSVSEPAVVSSPASETPPAPGPVTSGSRDKTVHVIQAGDTLQSIAAHYRLAEEDLIRWNRLRDSDAIFVGQVLSLRDRSESGLGEDPPDDAPTFPTETEKGQVKDMLDRTKEGLKNVGRKVVNVGK